MTIFVEFGLDPGRKLLRKFGMQTGFGLN